MKKKLIVHCTIHFGGGVFSVIEELIRSQIQNGYSVGLLVPEKVIYRAYNSEVLCCEDVLKIPIKLKNNSLLQGMPIKKYYNHLKRTNNFADIIFHIHGLASIGLFRNIKNVNCVCTIHGMAFNNCYSTSFLQKIVYKGLLNKNSKFTAVSNHSKDFHSQFTKKEIKVIYNGISDRPSFCYKNDVNRESFIVGFVGNLSFLKGWEFIIEAYLQLDSAIQNIVQIIIVGAGEDEEKLKRLLEDDQLSKGVSYSGSIPDAGKKIIPEFDCLVLPSLSEGLPMVILEAMRCGVPILATSVGGIPEVLENEVTGLFIRRNSEDIANAIEKLILHPILYRSMKIKCKEKFQEKFISQKMVEQYEALYWKE